MQRTTTAGIVTLVVDAEEPTRQDFPPSSPEETLAGLALSPGAALLVDLRAVAAARSSLFGFLARLKTLLSSQGSRLVVLVGHPELERIMGVLGLRTVFYVARDVAAAVRACRLEAAEPHDAET